MQPAIKFRNCAFFQKMAIFFVASCNPRYILESKNERDFAFSMHRGIVTGWQDLLSHTYPEIELAFFLTRKCDKNKIMSIMHF